MASFVKYLECSICLNVFTNPKELTCGHVFCKSCLDETIIFDADGKGQIKCALCNQETIIAKNQTTADLPISLLVKNAASDHNEERLANISKCSTSDCDNRLAMICANCPVYLCKRCSDDHFRRTHHILSPVCFDRDDSIKITCLTHNNPVSYFCTCDDSLICKYCSKREHAEHDYRSIDELIKRLKETLEMEVERQSYVPQNLQKMKEDVERSKKDFEKSLKYRKNKNLLKYIGLLEEEEKILLREFQALTDNHLAQYDNTKDAVNFQANLKRSDIELAVLKENIVQSIMDNRIPNLVSTMTVLLLDYDFLDTHPLGTIREINEHIGFAEVHNSTTFIFRPSQDDVDDTEKLQTLASLVKEFNIHVDKSKKVHGTSDEGANGLSTENTSCEATTSLRQKQEDLQKRFAAARNEYQQFGYIRRLLREEKDEEGVLFLITNNEGLASMTCRGSTIPHLVATWTDNVSLLKTCIDRGGDPLTLTTRGWNILHCAVTPDTKPNMVKYISWTYPQMLEQTNPDFLTPLKLALDWVKH